MFSSKYVLHGQSNTYSFWREQYKITYTLVKCMHPEYTVLWLPSPTPSLGWHSWGKKSSMTVSANFQSLQNLADLNKALGCWHVPRHYSKQSTTVKSFHINWTRGWHIAALIAITYFLHIYTIILIEQIHSYKCTSLMKTKLWQPTTDLQQSCYTKVLEHFTQCAECPGNAELTGSLPNFCGHILESSSPKNFQLLAICN